MSDSKNKYSEDTSDRERTSFIGKIIVTVVCVVLCIFMVWQIYAQFKDFLIPFIVILVFGIILATVWVKGLYIYRYMLPAALIIGVFTAYPIVYTVFIAFTNFGTGHMQSKDEAKKILITKVWDVDQNEPALYAEFFVDKDKKFNDYKNDYNRERNSFIKARPDAVREYVFDPIPSYMFGSAIGDKVYKAEDKEFVMSMYQLDEQNDEYIVPEDISIENYNKLVSILDKIEYIDLDEEFDWEEGTLNGIALKYYRDLFEGRATLSMLLYSKESVNDENIAETDIYKYDAKTKQISKISADEIDAFTADKAVIGELVYSRDGVERLSRLTVSSFENVYDQMKEANPIDIKKGDKTFQYLLEQSNQFLVKKHSYITKNDPAWNADVKDCDLLKLEVVDGSIKDYSLKVFEDNKDGKYTLTKDQQKVVYWKEYAVVDWGYEYGLMTLEKNAIAEEFLADKIRKNGLFDKIEAFNASSILNKPAKDVTASDLKAVKDSLKKVNKEIKKYNANQLKEDKKEYFKTKLAEINSLSSSMKKKAERALRKEKFPEISLIKLEQDFNSNIDYSIAIEPGYMVTVGMNNFTKIVTNRSITTPFIKVFIWTVIWSLVSVIGSFAVGLALALVFNSSELKGKYIYRTIFILPYAIPGFVSILMWSGFFNEDFGVINNLFNCHIPWLTSNGTMAKVSVLIVNIWMSFPYNMLISLGALQSIDSSMYEAADVDGASKPQQLWLITLPLLFIALGPMLVGSFAFAFNNFAGIYLLTGGGPVMAAGVLPGETDILISYTYKLAFGEQNKDYGLASAIAIIVFLIIGTITFLQFKFTGTFKEVDNA